MPKMYKSGFFLLLLLNLGIIPRNLLTYFASHSLPNKIEVVS